MSDQNKTQSQAKPDNKPEGKPAPDAGQQNVQGYDGQSRPPQLPTQQAQRYERPLLPPFMVELCDGDPKKCSGLIQVTTLRQQLRARWDKSKIIGYGEMHNRMPAIIPGVTLTVHPRDSKVIIHDPLTDNPALCEQIKRAQDGGEVTIRNAYPQPIKPTPTAEQELDMHELKTLMLEIARATYNKVPEGNFYVAVKGRVPTVQELEEYPGDELYDVMSNNPMKPRFKKDAEAWKHRLENVRNEVGV
jgi:hypothetical protein